MKKTEIQKTGSLFWLIFWILFCFPIAFLYWLFKMKRTRVYTK